MAKNTTGLPNTGDYTLGRGIVYESAIDSSTEKPDDGGWRDLGNATEFNVSLETEKLEHKSSRAGLQVVDKEVILSQKMTINFSLDELNDENVANFLSGTVATHTNVAIAGFADYEMIATVVLGRWYDIVASTDERAYDVETADVALTETTGAPVTLVEDTDYTLDLKNGRIFLLSTATNIAAGEPMSITLTANAGASTVEEVRGLTSGNIIRAIKFIGENPANSNKQREYQFHKVTVASEGDLSLIGDEYAIMAFSGTVESSVLADADAPYVRIRDHEDS
jgi:hypothetical protein